MNKNKGVAILESMRQEGLQKRKKWGNVVAAINEAYTSVGMEPLGEWKEITLTSVLETHQTRTAMMNGMTATESFTGTQPAQTSFIMKHGINILASAMSGLIANDIVSTQALSARIGEIRYLDVKYGTDKGNFKLGDTMFSHDRLGGPKGQFGYTSDEIDFEALVLNDATAKLEFLPVVAGSVTVFEDGNEIGLDNGEGKIMKGSTQVATVDYATGEVKFGTAPTGDATVSYRYDNITAPADAPELIMSIKQIPVQARSRKLKTMISFDSMYDLQVQFGFDAGAEASTLVSNYLQYEIDGEIVEDLMKNAGADSVEFSEVVPNAVSLLDHYEGFQKTLIEASNNIFEATRFGQGNWAVLGMTASTIVESLSARGGFTASGQTAQGPHFLGNLGNFSIYKTPLTADRDAFVTGYKGDNLFYAGYVYSPYLPLMSTDMLSYENFAVAQGFSTSYAKKITNPNLYAKGIVTR